MIKKNLISNIPSCSGTIFLFLISIPFWPIYMPIPSVAFHFRGLFSPISRLTKVLFPALHGPAFINRKNKMHITTKSEDKYHVNKLEVVGLRNCKEV